jgi:hypothetical protein
MNKRIILGVTIAFVVSFTILFLMHFISQDSRTIQNMENHPFFLSELDSKKSSIFLIGHSHVGQLNTGKINQIISQNYNNIDVYNLAMYHDTPSVRSEQIDKIIDLKPKTIFYGIAIADFLGPCKYTYDCNKIEKNELKLPDPNDFLNDLHFSKKLGIEQMNPKFTTLQFIRDSLSGNSLFPEQGRRLELQNNPFYVIDDTYTRITADSTLKKSVIVSSGNMINENTIQNSSEIKHLKEIIDKFQKNNIKVILFKTPHQKYYIENIPETSIKDYDLVLKKISAEMNVNIYDYFDKYADLPIWFDIEHVSYNEKSSAYTEDVAKMIILEIKE